jgi:hypothetical protein
VPELAVLLGRSTRRWSCSGSVPIGPQQEGHDRAARQEQADGEIRAQRPQLAKDPFHRFHGDAPVLASSRIDILGFMNISVLLPSYRMPSQLFMRKKSGVLQREAAALAEASGFGQLFGITCSHPLGQVCTSG